MHVLLTGATGFIGAALVERLRHDGHRLRLAVRDAHRAHARWPDVESVRIEFGGATRAASWLPLLQGIDAVINAVGIIRQTPTQTFEMLHVKAPIALFEAAADAGVARVIQISALGADADARSAYHLSKREADAALAASRLHSSIVQPSLVFGPGGASAASFERLARLALIPLPGDGSQRVQPIHVDDLCDALARLLLTTRMPPRLAAVGSECVTVKDYLAALRRGLRHEPARWVRVPMPLVRAAARLGDHIAGMPFDTDRLAMLERGNCADAGNITALLGRRPRGPGEFIAPPEGFARAYNARLANRIALLRTSIAIVWLVSGFVSLGAWPIRDSLALLARCGLHGTIAYAALYGAAALDIVFGVGTLALRGGWRMRLYDAQIAVILVYSALIATYLPEFLLHPFAPIVKNLAILAALLLLRTAERR